MMIHRLADMIGSPHTQAGLPDGRWVRAVPCPVVPGVFGRLSAAWAVLTGKAHAVRWPEHGELERALNPPEPRRDIQCWRPREDSKWIAL